MRVSCPLQLLSLHTRAVICLWVWLGGRFVLITCSPPWVMETPALIQDPQGEAMAHTPVASLSPVSLDPAWPPATYAVDVTTRSPQCPRCRRFFSSSARSAAASCPRAPASAPRSLAPTVMAAPQSVPVQTAALLPPANLLRCPVGLGSLVPARPFS